MTDSSHETSMLLGSFKTQIANLTDAVKEQVRKSEERGSRTYRELEQIRLEQAEISRDVKSVRERLTNETEEIRKSLQYETDQLRTRIDAAEPTLSEIKRWRERFIGMMLVIGFLGSVLGGVVTLAWKWIQQKLGF